MQQGAEWRRSFKEATRRIVIHASEAAPAMHFCIPVAIVMTLLPGAFGWFQGWMNEKRCGGSIIPSWLLHGTINVAVAALSL